MHSLSPYIQVLVLAWTRPAKLQLQDNRPAVNCTPDVRFVNYTRLQAFLKGMHDRHATDTTAPGQDSTFNMRQAAAAACQQHRMGLLVLNATRGCCVALTSDKTCLVHSSSVMAVPAAVTKAM